MSSFLQKWYTSVLTLLMENLSQPVKSQTLGFTAGRQTLECTELMRLLLQRTSEWRIPFAIGVGDIFKAFDNMDHDMIEQSLR